MLVMIYAVNIRMISLELYIYQYIQFHSGYNYLPLITIDILCILQYLWGFPGDTSVKEPAGQCRRHKRLGLNSWVWKIPWRRAGQPTPVFLPGESHGQRSLVGYKSIRSHKDTTQVTYHEQGFLQGHKNVLELDTGDGCTTLYKY